jgi:DNA-binding beta-propeller fold protein YncE
MAAACAPAATPPAPASAPTSAAPSSAAPTAAPTTPIASTASETVYVFNVGSKDVTIVDAASRQVRETRPLGAAVRWLSNEQTFWDGQHVWTYDFPDNRLQAIAIEPKSIAIARSIESIGTGPGHSLMVFPDKRKAAVNVAGDNVIAFLDLASGQVEATVQTGAFP